MNDLPLNIVFFPHSANHGLAGTNRLQNIIFFLTKEGVGSIANIALLDKPANVPFIITDPFIKEYKEIFYGPSVINFIKHIFQTIIILKKYRRSDSKNVMYFYGEVDIKNFFFLKWARLIGYKIIIDVVEDLEAFTSFKSFKNKLKYKSGIFFRKRLDGYADGFTVVSTLLDEKIHAAYPKIPRFFLPVTINKYLLNNDKVNAQYEGLKIFYSGSFNEKDGLPYLLAALQIIANSNRSFKLILSGKGTESEMKKFWLDVREHKLDDFVDYRGFLSRKEYMKVLSAEADVLCMTRVNSAYANAGFPFKLGEFLGTGKPVIASTIGDIEKYLSINDAYLVQPENPTAIKNAINDIFDDNEKAIKIGLKGRKVAMRFFDHELYSVPLKEFLMAI